jgi:error-prone DNA polymerase
MQLKGIKRAALEQIVENRHQQGRFVSFEDFLGRMPQLDPGDIRILIKAGCFDGVAGREARPRLMWQLYQARSPQQHQGQTASLLASGETDSYYLPATGPYSERTMLIHEMDVLGFLVSRHPLSLYRELLSHLAYVRACDLHRHVGREITVIGWLITGKVVHTRTDEPMEFISFEDTTALYETVFFPEVYRRFCRMLSKVRPYLIRGLVEEDYGAISLTVRRIEYLDKVRIPPGIVSGRRRLPEKSAVRHA